MDFSEDNTSQLTTNELIRYARHLSLPEIGIKGQERLKFSSVLCVGCGGLGSPLLLYLASVGVGEIGIVDFDLVEESNLQRQTIHSTEWLSKPKTSSARDRILKINPYCKVKVFNLRLDNNNIFRIFSDFDVICDCTDNFPTRYLINDACVILGKPIIYGSIQGFHGQTTIFNLTKDSPNYRDLLPDPPPNDLVPSCSQLGVLGILPGIIGLIQATEVIKVITMIGDPLDGRLLVFDALKMKFKELRLIRDKNAKEITDLVDYQDLCSTKTKQSDISNISVLKLRDLLLDENQNILLLDVRESFEHNLNAIPGSELIPLGLIKNGEGIDHLIELKKNKTLYIYCQTGQRSVMALDHLKLYDIQGFNVEGGLDEWERIIQGKLRDSK